MRSDTARSSQRSHSRFSGQGVYWLVSTDAVFTIDLLAGSLARITGLGPPSPGQPPDGETRAYQALLVERDGIRLQVELPRAGDRVTVTWGNGSASTALGTAVSVADRPAWNGPYRLAAPLNLPGAPTFVVSGEDVVAACATQQGALTMAALLTVAAFENPTAIGGSQIKVCSIDTPATRQGERWRRPWIEAATLPADVPDGDASRHHPRALHAVHN